MSEIPNICTMMVRGASPDKGPDDIIWQMTDGSKALIQLTAGGVLRISRHLKIETGCDLELVELIDGSCPITKTIPPGVY